MSLLLARLSDRCTAEFTVVPASLARGRTYEQAVKSFEPYREIQDLSEGARSYFVVQTRRAELQAHASPAPAPAAAPSPPRTSSEKPVSAAASPATGSQQRRILWKLRPVRALIQIVGNLKSRERRDHGHPSVG